MAYVQLFELFPETAMKETRTITVFEKNLYGLPPGNYGLLEMYCNDKDCDCRRVIIAVMSSVTKSVVAYISFGWESKKYYAKWYNRGEDIVFSEMDDLDRLAVNQMHGIHLNMSSKQSKIAPIVLWLVSEQVLKDKAYVERIKRHYALFRAKINKQYRNK